MQETDLSQMEQLTDYHWAIGIATHTPEVSG